MLAWHRRAAESGGHDRGCVQVDIGDNRTNSFPSSRRMCSITAAKEKKDEQGLAGWPGSRYVNFGSARGFMAERIILI